jgi:hypothetical protein
LRTYELGFGTKRPPGQIRPPRPRSKATPPSGALPASIVVGASFNPQLAREGGANQIAVGKAANALDLTGETELTEALFGS